jgi:hypothetical protein
MTTHDPDMVRAVAYVLEWIDCEVDEEFEQQEPSLARGLTQRYDWLTHEWPDVVDLQPGMTR